VFCQLQLTNCFRTHVDIVACRAVSKQRLCTYVPTATYTCTTIKILLETAFSTRCVQRGYKEENWGNRVNSVRESVKKRNSLK
jgi:hypothetical protein